MSVSFVLADVTMGARHAFAHNGFTAAEVRTLVVQNRDAFSQFHQLRVGGTGQRAGVAALLFEQTEFFRGRSQEGDPRVTW